MTASRIDKRFAALKAEDRAGLVTFVLADPRLPIPKPLIVADPPCAMQGAARA